MSNVQYHKKNLKEKLFSNFSKQLEKQGKDAVSVRQTCQELGVSEAAYYHYYKSKAELLTQIAHSYRLELDKVMKEIAEQEANSQELLLKLGEAYIDFAFARPHVFDLMFSKKYSHFDQNELEKIGIVPVFRHLYHCVSVLSDDKNKYQKFKDSLLIWSGVHGIAILLRDGPLAENEKDVEILKSEINKPKQKTNSRDSIKILRADLLQSLLERHKR